MLRPRPAGFRVHMAAGHTDAQLFAWISEGVDGTAMPAIRAQLSSEGIWHSGNFIKTFEGGERGVWRVTCSVLCHAFYVLRDTMRPLAAPAATEGLEPMALDLEPQAIGQST